MYEGGYSSRMATLATQSAEDHSFVKDALHRLGGSVEAVERTNDRVPGVTPAMLAAGTGQADCIDALAKLGTANVNRADPDGRTAILWSARAGHADCVDALVRAGADVNRRDALDKTAVRMAADGGHAGCLDALLHAGADADRTDIFGASALMAATTGCHLGCVERLILAGASVNVADREGYVRGDRPRANDGSLSRLNP